jgi:hypothetical protein
MKTGWNCFGPTRSAQGFTRIEIGAVLGTVALLAMVVLAASAATRSDSERVVCFNNLRMLGQAFLAFEESHGGRVSWRTPIYEGGTFSIPKPANAWYEFSFHSNNIPSPRILACPADSGVRVAKSFREYTSSGFRAAATSYVIDLDPNNHPQAWLSADRNLRLTSIGSCSAGVSAAPAIAVGSPLAGWTNAVHGVYGNVLLRDGSVRYTDSVEFRSLILTNSDDNGNAHFLPAR